MNNFLHIIISILLFLTTLYSSEKLDKVSLQLHWKYQFEFAGFIAAKEKGFYKDSGLDVDIKEYEFGTDIVDEVLSGRSTYGMYNSSILLSYLQGKPIVLMASFLKRSAMILITKPDISSPKDLIGKKIMADTKKDFDLKFKYMFNTQNIDTKDLTLVKHTYNVDDFASAKVDAMAAFISNQPYKLDKLGIKYNILDPSEYGMYNLMDELFTSKDEVNNYPQRTKKFRDASIKGWEYALEHIDEIVQIIHKKYAQDIDIDVLKNEAKKIKKLILPYTYEIGSIDKNFLIRQEELFKKEYMIKDNKKSIDDFILNIKNRVILTDKERNYLSTKPTVKYVYDPDWKPFEWKNSLDEHTGILSDILKLISLRSGIKFIALSSDNWSESVKLVKLKKANMYSAIPPTDERKKYLKFTTANIYSYNAVFLTTTTKKDFTIDSTNNSLIGKRIGVIRSNSLGKYIKDNYPRSTFIELSSMRDGFKSLREDKIDLFAINAVSAYYYMNSEEYENLKIDSKTDHLFNLKLAITKDMPAELLSILDKYLASITRDEKRAIFDKWTTLKIQKDKDWRLIWQIIIISSVLFIIISYMYSRQIRLNRELLKHKELYNLVFENSANAVLIMDLDSKKFVDCNFQTVKMLKYNSKVDILGRHLADLSPKLQPDGRDSKEYASKQLDTAIKNWSNTFEWVYVKSDGEEFWVEITLTLIIFDEKKMMHVIWKDIDEKKIANERLEDLNKTLDLRVKVATKALEEKNSKLQDANNNFQKLIDIAMEMIIISDDEHKIVDINYAGLRILEYTKDEVLGTKLLSHVEKSNIEVAKKAIIKDYQRPYHLKIKTSTGRAIPVLVSGKNIIRNSKTYRIITLFDMSEIENTHRQMLQQNRLAQMGEMISMIAHQWRQPLSAISATSASLCIKAQIGSLDKDIVIELSNKITEYAQHLSLTIDDFRNFFKDNKIKDSVSIEKMVISTLDIVQISLENSNIKVDLVINSNKEIDTYVNEVKQVILNIIKNSEDALIEKKIKNPYIKIVIEDTILTISDNAGGIPEDIIDKIFEPYFSTKTKKDGTGLGLYMSKTIIEEHCGGKLSVFNATDGAVFKIELGEKYEIST